MMQYSKVKMATNTGICADSFSLNYNIPTLLFDYHIHISSHTIRRHIITIIVKIIIYYKYMHTNPSTSNHIN